MSSSKIHMSCNELYKTVLNLDVVRTSEEEGNKEIFGVDVAFRDAPFTGTF